MRTILNPNIEHPTVLQNGDKGIGNYKLIVQNCDHQPIAQNLLDDN
jgi:hypothetical protein